MGWLQPSRYLGQQTRAHGFSGPLALKHSLATPTLYKSENQVNNAFALASDADLSRIPPTLVSDTTIYNTDGDSRPVEPVHKPSLTGLLDSATCSTSENSTLLDFIKRPYVIDYGLWNDANDTIIHSSDWPDRFLTIPDFRAKVQGFLGLRGKIRFQLTVNSEPFQAGRLMLFYIPYAQYSRNKAAAIVSTKTGHSGCPNVQLDIATQSECSLTMDMISPHTYYNLVTGQGSFGTLYISSYGNLNDISGKGVSWTLTASMVEPELSIPTRAPVAVDPGPTIFRAANNIRPLTANDAELPTAQIGNELKEASITGVIASASKAVATLAEAAGPFAALFGWSKPTDQSPNTITRPRLVNHLLHTDGIDYGTNLGSTVGTELDTPPGLFGSQEDEMTVAHIVSRPEFVKQANWSTADLAGSVIASFDVSPTAAIADLVYIDTDRQIKQGNPTHLYALSRAFAYWRGGITFTFKVVKTKLHSGRLRVSWIPGATSATGALDPNHSHSSIIDLRSTSGFTYTVPYAHTRPFRRCNQLDGVALGLINDSSNGYLQVSVYEQLRAAPNCPTTIQILMEMNGAPDFCFSVPVTANNIAFRIPDANQDSTTGYAVARHAVMNDIVEQLPPTTRPNFLPLYNTIDEEEMEVDQLPTAQIGTESDNHNFNSAEYGPFDSYAKDAHMLCHGERTASIRSVVKHFIQAEVFDQKLNKYIFIQPWLLQRGSVVIATPQRAFIVGSSYFDYFGFFYAFYRGGRRFKIIHDYTNRRDVCSVTLRINRDVTPYIEQPVTSGRLNTETYIEFDPNIGFNGYRAVSTMTQPLQEGTTEFTIPCYGMQHIYPTIDGSSTLYTSNNSNIIDKLATAQLQGNVPSTNVYFCSANGEPDTFRVYAACADDFSFGCLVGLPPCTVVTT